MRADAEVQVARRGLLARAHGVERHEPGARHPATPAGVGQRGPPVVMGPEVVGGEDRVLEVHEPRVPEEARRQHRAPVLLGGPEVGEREDRSVVTGPRERPQAAVHLLEDDVHALGIARRADIGAGGVVARAQPGQQRGPRGQRGLGGRAPGPADACRQSQGEERVERAEAAAPRCWRWIQRRSSWPRTAVSAHRGTVRGAPVGPSMGQMRRRKRGVRRDIATGTAAVARSVAPICGICSCAPTAVAWKVCLEQTRPGDSPGAVYDGSMFRRQ